MHSKPLNPKTIRTENRKRIVQLLYKQRELTLLDMSRTLGLSIPTVTKNVEQLVVEGLAEKAGVSASVVGRRPVVIRFLPDAYYTVGVELAPDSVRIVLTNLDLAIRAERLLAAVDYQQLDAVMTAVQSALNDMLAQQRIPRTQVLGVGLAIPGTVNDETQIVKLAPNLRLQNTGFAQYQSLFALPLFIENEANAAAMAELTLGVAKAMRNLVYISVLLKGVGTGIVVGGQLYRGHNKRAGEYGHTTIASHGKLCPCGRKDCWELYASGYALLTGYADRTGQMLTTLEQFFATLNAGNIVAQQTLDDYLEYLTIGIEDILLAQDPHDVIIGGTLSRFAEYFLDTLRQKIFRANNFYDGHDVNISGSTLRGDASILGAALLPCQQMLFEGLPVGGRTLSNGGGDDETERTSYEIVERVIATDRASYQGKTRR
jgi:predicted NBD/HSP70 family sugar kinase